MKNLILIIATFYSFSAFAQTDFRGVWATGDDNTKIEISKEEGQIIGRIKSSDNEKAKIGKVILKGMKKNGSKWTGRIYAAKRGEWYDVEISPDYDNDVLNLKVSAGFFTKSLEWKKSK